MTATPLSSLLKLPAYRELRQHVFPSENALLWFVRQHKAELVEAGALVLLTNQWHADGERFDAVVLGVGQRAAARKAAA